MALLDGRPLKRYVPQAHYLSITTLGAGKGFARRSAYRWLGRASFLLKDWIDRRFLRGHQARTTGRADTPPAHHPTGHSPGSPAQPFRQQAGPRNQ
jgi:hypothetical protein